MNSVNPLRLRRLAKGMTQTALADAAGISQQLMSKLEAGTIRLTVEKAEHFAKILECRPAELIPSLAMNPQPETRNLQELKLLTLYRDLPETQQDVIFALAEILSEKRATAN